MDSEEEDDDNNESDVCFMATHEDLSSAIPELENQDGDDCSVLTHQ